MTTQREQFDGDLWFFIGAESGAAYGVERDRQVNVSYAAPDKDAYVSISGRAK